MHIGKKRNTSNTIEHKVRTNMEFIEGEILDMIGTIKMFSTEQRHGADLHEAAQRKDCALTNVVLMRNIDEFWHNFYDTLSFSLVIYLILHFGLDIDNGQLVAFFLL